MAAGVVSKTGVKEESAAAGRPCGGDTALANGICAFHLALITNEIQAELIWEISSLLCSRNCARKDAVSVAYTILYIASLGTARTVNSNQIINLKTKKNYGKERNVFGSGSRGSGGDG